MTPADGTAIRSDTLDNGLTVLLEPMPWLRSASVALLLPAGSATDPVGGEGSATILNDWTSRGAGELDSRAFTAAVDALGVRRGGSADRESTTFAASLIAERLESWLALLALQLRSPQLDDDEFEGARELAQQELASLKDRPSSRLFESLTRAYFSSGHGRSPYGTAEGLASLTPAAVRDDFVARYTPSGAILAVAGGVSWEELKGAVSRSGLADWRGGAQRNEEPVVAGAGAGHVDADTAQTQIGLCFPALAPGHADWYLQSLAAGVLSGGSSARLFTEVREKRGLVYAVGAAVRAVRGAGYVIGYAGTTPERAEETLDVMLAEFRRLRQGVTADEFERARKGRLSELVLQGESSGARAGALVADQFLRGGPRQLAEIEAALLAVSLDQVNGFLERTELADPTVLTLGPAAPRIPAGAR